MLYPVYVHPGNEREAHGVMFPDFPGCFAAADRWEDLPAAIQEAVQAHFYEEPETVPPPTPIGQLTQREAYRDGVWMLADIDLSRIASRPVRLNISLPAHLVKEIDSYASARHMTRSGFLAMAAQRAMTHAE